MIYNLRIGQYLTLVCLWTIHTSIMHFIAIDFEDTIFFCLSQTLNNNVMKLLMLSYSTVNDFGECIQMFECPAESEKGIHIYLSGKSEWRLFRIISAIDQKLISRISLHISFPERNLHIMFREFPFPSRKVSSLDLNNNTPLIFSVQTERYIKLFFHSPILEVSTGFWTDSFRYIYR